MNHHLVCLELDDRLVCDKCKHERVVDEAWLSSFEAQKVVSLSINKSRLVCSKCSTKGEVSVITSWEYEEIMNEVKEHDRLREIEEYVRKNYHPGRPYKPITKGAWWTSSEANYEDLIRRKIENDAE